MSDIDGKEKIEPPPSTLSRRDLIKGVIVGGVAVSSASYLFAPPLWWASRRVARARGSSPST